MNSVGGLIVGQNKPFEESRKRIKNWLLQRHHSIEETQEQGKAWVIVAHEPEGGMNFGFAVSQDLGEPDVIGFGMTLPLFEWQAALNRLPAEERTDFLYDLRFRLLEIGVDFSVPLDSLPQIPFFQHLYTEDLTKTNFWGKVQVIQRAVLATLWTFERKFGLPKRGQPFAVNLTPGNH